MPSPECALCGLPATERSRDGEGRVFCCRGCLRVHEALGDSDVSREEVLRRAAEAPLDGEEVDRALAERGEDAVFDVDGMWCSTCAAFLEAELPRGDGVLAVDASYANEMARVAYDPAETGRDEVKELFADAGYTATDPGERTDEGSVDARWVVAGLFSMLVMMLYVNFLYPVYLGMTETYYYGDLATVESQVPGGLGPLLLVLTAPVLFYSGGPILRSAWVSLRARSPNMATLVGAAAVSAFLYSGYAAVAGEPELYFDIAVMLIVVVMLGKSVERWLKHRSTRALRDLAEEGIGAARLETGEEVAVEEVGVGDRVLVRPGERVPVDGRVVDGASALDTALLTGEHLPHDAAPGDHVDGGAVNLEAPVVVEATRPGADSAVNRLTRELWRVQSGASDVQRAVDRVAGLFVPGVLLLAAAAALYHLQSGASRALLVGVSVLVASCPCALGLATPMALASGAGRAADAGVLVTEPGVLETAHRVDTAVLDKTSTLTTGETALGSVETLDAERSEVLGVAAALERYSDHPVAAAFRTDTGFEADPGDVAVRTGLGVEGTVQRDGQSFEAMVGGRRLLEGSGVPVPEDAEVAAEEIRGRGGAPVFVAYRGGVRGVAEVTDRLRPGAADLVRELRSRGAETAMVTGDAKAAAARVADAVEVDRFEAEVPPGGKADAVRELQGEGRTVLMVGDGANDSLALAAADVGVAVGSGADVALESGDAALRGDLSGVPGLLDASAATRARVRQNLAWALSYNGVALPLAVTGLLNPLLAAVAMSLSSVVVVTNSVRDRL